METLKVNLEKLRKSTWTEEEYGNAEVICDFVQHLMNDHNFEYIKENMAVTPINSTTRVWSMD
ncbi:MAG: hypothetical protein AAGC45_14420 [Bacteroidota bacterium]